MLKNTTFLALAGSLVLASLSGCDTTTDEAGDETPGDGDGDATGDGDGDATGDGDGDATGDGDGDATGDGDGDGDATGDGDGDGDATGDGDGDPPANMCGWNPANIYYECGFEGEDPSGTFPLECDEGLVEGEPCGALDGWGCCDANGDNWWCGQGEVLERDVCGA